MACVSASPARRHDGGDPRRSAIDLIVLDLRLGGEDGMAIARRLRDESAIPIIMLTAFAMKPTV